MLVQVSLLELDDTPDLGLEGSEEDLRRRILADPDIVEAGVPAYDDRTRNFRRSG